MALHQNPAAIIAAKLQLEKPIPAKVLQETHSALRLLKSRNPNGSFGRQDNDLKRACALLEYIVREREGYKIPISSLAKAACMKLRDFENFHALVGNFRGSFSSASKQTSLSLKKGGKQSRHTSSNQSSISSLAIKLGSYVQDANGVSVRAIKLFSDIKCNAKSKYQLQDMQQHQKAYEAACFYIAATSDDASKSHKGLLDDDNNKLLEISNISDVSTDFTLAEFKSILHHVQNLRETTPPSQTSKTQKSNKKNETTSKIRKRQKVENSATALAARISSKRTKSTGLLSEDLASSATFDLLQKADTHQGISHREESSTKMQRLAEWKRSVLTLAMENVRKQMINDDGEEISDDKALDLAVVKVLNYYGYSLA